MLDLTQLTDLKLHPAMAWLGRQQWLTISDFGENIALEPNWRDLERLPDSSPHLHSLRNMIQGIEHCRRNGKAAFGASIASTVLMIDAIATVFAYGPKVFAPTEEQFESMQHVSVDFPVNEYHQCYPALIIEYPAEGRRQLARKFGIPPEKAPRAAVVRHRQEDRVILVHHGLQPSGDMTERCQIVHGRKAKSIEEALDQCDEYEKDSLSYFVQAAAHVAINCALLLTHFGCTVTGPVNPRDYERHRRKKHLQKFSYSDAIGLALNRRVIARKVVVVRREHQGGGGWEMPPGWRRGHWRRRPNTPADSAKTVLVNPTFVRPDRLEGDPGDTFTTYEAL